MVPRAGARNRRRLLGHRCPPGVGPVARAYRHGRRHVLHARCGDRLRARVAPPARGHRRPHPRGRGPGGALRYCGDRRRLHDPCRSILIDVRRGHRRRHWAWVASAPGTRRRHHSRRRCTRQRHPFSFRRAPDGREPHHPSVRKSAVRQSPVRHAPVRGPAVRHAPAAGVGGWRLCPFWARRPGR